MPSASAGADRWSILRAGTSKTILSGAAQRGFRAAAQAERAASCLCAASRAVCAIDLPGNRAGAVGHQAGVRRAAPMLPSGTNRALARFSTSKYLSEMLALTRWPQQGCRATSALCWRTRRQLGLNIDSRRRVGHFFPGNSSPSTVISARNRLYADRDRHQRYYHHPARVAIDLLPRAGGARRINIFRRKMTMRPAETPMP